MSIQHRQSEVARYQRELAALRKQDADEAKKEANLARTADQAARSLNSTRNPSTARTYSQRLAAVSGDQAKVQTKRADIAKKIADKTSRLHQAEQALAKEQEREHKKVQQAEKKWEHDLRERHLQLSRELESRASDDSPEHPPSKLHDAFISHASEDKESFVRPLADALRSAGFDIWYDEFSLTVGDSLRQNIDRGLANSRYGIVVLSSAFISKNWPQYELNGLVAKEMEGRKVVLPIWHKVTKDEVMAFSPPLADKVAINTSILSIAEVVDQLARVLKRG